MYYSPDLDDTRPFDPREDPFPYSGSGRKSVPRRNKYVPPNPPRDVAVVYGPQLSNDGYRMIMYRTFFPEHRLNLQQYIRDSLDMYSRVTLMAGALNEGYSGPVGHMMNNMHVAQINCDAFETFKNAALDLYVKYALEIGTSIPLSPVNEPGTRGARRIQDLQTVTDMTRQWITYLNEEEFVILDKAVFCMSPSRTSAEDKNDAAFLLKCGIMETAKHLVLVMLDESPEAEQIIDKLVSSARQIGQSGGAPQSLAETLGRRMLLNLIVTIQKLVLDKISKASVVVRCELRHESALKAERARQKRHDKYRRWVNGYRADMAMFSMVCDEPGEACRQLSEQLYRDYGLFIDQKLSEDARRENEAAGGGGVRRSRASPELGEDGTPLSPRPTPPKMGRVVPSDQPSTSAGQAAPMAALRPTSLLARPANRRLSPGVACPLNWMANLYTYISCFRCLGDTAMLYGIRQMARQDKLPYRYTASLDAARSNLFGHYERTEFILAVSRNKVLQGYENPDPMTEKLLMSQQAAIESLHAKYHMHKLIEMSPEDPLFELAGWVGTYYKHYITTLRPIQDDAKLHELRDWLTTWQDPKFMSVPGHDGSHSLMEAPDVTGWFNWPEMQASICINVAAFMENGTERVKWLDRGEAILTEYHASRNFFPPCGDSRALQTVWTSLEVVRQGFLNTDVLDAHADDFKWQQLLHRQLWDAGQIPLLRMHQAQDMDHIQIRVCKWHRIRGNYIYSQNLYNTLTAYPSSNMHCKLLCASSQMKMEFLSSTWLNPVTQVGILCEDWGNTAKYFHNRQKIHSRDLADMLLRMMRLVVRYNPFIVSECERHLAALMIFTVGLNKPGTRRPMTPEKAPLMEDLPNGEPEYRLSWWRHQLWTPALQLVDLDSRTKTLLVLADLANRTRLNADPNNWNMNAASLRADLYAFHSLSGSSRPKHRSALLEVGTRIIEAVYKRHSTQPELDYMLNLFSDYQYLRDTSKSWGPLRHNLIGRLTCKEPIEGPWRHAMSRILAELACCHPYLLVYTVVVNRMECRNEMNILRRGRAVGTLELDARLMCFLSERAPEELLAPPGSALGECRYRNVERRLRLWDDLYAQFTTGFVTEPAAGQRAMPYNYAQMAVECNEFVAELRSVTMISGDCLRLLKLRLPRRLEKIARLYSMSPSSYLPELQVQFEKTCHRCAGQIRALIDSSSAKRLRSAYDTWFYATFSKLLGSLEKRLMLMVLARPQSRHEVEELCYGIPEYLRTLISKLQEYDNTTGKNMSICLIAPRLSKLSPGVVPMPDCHELIPGCPLIMINRVVNGIERLISKTMPKQITFVAADGSCHRFLAKSQDDLRIDEFIMEVLAYCNLAINVYRYREKEWEEDDEVPPVTFPAPMAIRRYPITPLGCRAGLIGWVDGMSVLRLYCNWLDTCEGRQMVSKLYAESCAVLCTAERGHRSTHPNCDRPEKPRTTDIYLQLLWTRAYAKLNARPTTVTSARLRLKLGLPPYLDVHRAMVERTPDDLLSRGLWRAAPNSFAYWRNTQHMARSCAAMSIVGYLVGLGDRHADNMLIEPRTGALCHIDYNVCLDTGKALAIPERVPFRLTQNLVRSFGFAGLDGPYKRTCRRVLNALKEHTPGLSSMLHYSVIEFLISDRPFSERLMEPSLGAPFSNSPRSGTSSGSEQQLDEEEIEPSSAATSANIGAAAPTYAYVSTSADHAATGPAHSYASTSADMGAAAPTYAYGSTSADPGDTGPAYAYASTSADHAATGPAYSYAPTSGHIAAAAPAYAYASTSADLGATGPAYAYGSTSTHMAAGAPPYAYASTSTHVADTAPAYAYGSTSADLAAAAPAYAYASTSTHVPGTAPAYAYASTSTHVAGTAPASTSDAGAHVSNNPTPNVPSVSDLWNPELAQQRLLDRLAGMDSSLSSAMYACKATNGADRSPYHKHANLFHRLPMTTDQHVEALVHEATSHSNLAQMYEGWGAWI